MCTVKCSNEDPKALGPGCTGATMSCYVCTDCAYVNLETSFDLNNCRSSTGCVTILTQDGKINRGCDDLHMKTECNAVGTNCTRCNTDQCNNRIYAIFCHQCTSFDPGCMYEQKDTFGMQCPLGNFTVEPSPVCYTGFTWVIRFCF